MSYNRELEIEKALNSGEEILRQRPELYEMDCETLLDELDDGTREMIHNRWGVAAWIAVKKLQSFSIENLVKELPVSYGNKFELSREYTGYLLQWKYQVRLDLLLLEAQRQGIVDQIESFAASNLEYGQQLAVENVSEMLELLEQNRTKKWYFKTLHGYAELVEHMEQQYSAASQLGELSNQAECEFIWRLGRSWYENKPLEVEQYVRKLLAYSTMWSKKAAIDLIAESLYSTQKLFEEHFDDLCSLADCDCELWNSEIPIWVRYALRYKNITGKIKEKVLERLHTLPDNSIEEKLQFVGALQFEDEPTEEIQGILDQIQFSDFQKNSKMLTLLDQYYWQKLDDTPDDSVFKDLQQIFQANQYGCADYRNFFDGMSAVTSMLHNKSGEAAAYGIREIVRGGLAEVIFGAALLSEVGNLTELKAVYQADPAQNIYSEENWIRVMQVIRYLIADSNRICGFAFRLPELMKTSQLYLDFCMDEIYGNYPGTMQEQAEKYRNSECESQKILAKMVLEQAERERAEHEITSKIRDLWPSAEHEILERKAQWEQNRAINKNAEKASVFTSLFPSRTLKYGSRSGHIVTGRKHEMTYNSQPFAHISCKMELPKLYTDDPVEYELRRNAFWEEVKRNASGN